MKSTLTAIIASVMVFGLLAWQTNTWQIESPSMAELLSLPISVQGSTESKLRKKESLDSALPDLPTSSMTVAYSPQNEHEIVVSNHLKQARFRAASDYVNQNYSALSSDQLEQLRNLFIYSNDQQPLALERLNVAAILFDDLPTWSALALGGISQNNWQVAHTALLRVSLLENRPIELEETLQALVQSSSHLRAAKERNKNFLGIRALYQELHQAHPWYPRFRLELAHAQATLGDVDAAEQHYLALQYDPNYGAIASQSLAYLAQSATEIAINKVVPQTVNQIRVPLIQTGTSLLVPTLINGRSTALLLDTGASITALSSGIIQQLGLKPTGQRINIKTANGTRESALFFADSISFGKMQLSNIEVAEIDLGSNSNFVGLLGTDALSAFDQDFDYVIDQRQRALVFTPREAP